GSHFQQYASIWIRQSITRAVADHSRLIRIPVHLHESVSKLEQAWDEIARITGEAPTLFSFSLTQGWLTREDIDILSRQSQFDHLTRRLRPYMASVAAMRSSIAKRSKLRRRLQSTLKRKWA